MTHRGDPADPLYLIYKQISAHGYLARKPQPSSNQVSPVLATKSPRPQGHLTASLWQFDGVVMAIRRRQTTLGTGMFDLWLHYNLNHGKLCVFAPKGDARFGTKEGCFY